MENEKPVQYTITAAQLAALVACADPARVDAAAGIAAEVQQREYNPASDFGKFGGAKGGSAKSEAKRAAARANGAKGGRPRKTPQSITEPIASPDLGTNN
jgi:hypothetical protein